jgi:hypothetical protein
MTNPGDRFSEIAARLRQGEEPSPETVRTVLSWFGAQRRGAWVVGRIRSALKSAGLETVPEVSSTYLDGQLRFALRDDTADKQTQAPLADASAQTAVTVLPADPTYRLARMHAGRCVLVGVLVERIRFDRERAVVLTRYDSLSAATRSPDVYRSIPSPSGGCGSVDRTERDTPSPPCSTVLSGSLSSCRT